MRDPRRLVHAGALYFLCVFGAGFGLGALRVTLVVPRLVIIVSARWVVRRLGPAPAIRVRLGAGAVALALLAGAELALVVAQGLSPREYLASRDPVSGSAYLLMQVVYAAMPCLVGGAHAGARGA